MSTNDISLDGWDDGKIYYYESGKGSRCVNDEPELFQLLIKTCEEFYGKKDQCGPDNRRNC